MEEKLNEIYKSLILPIALLTLAGGFITVYKDTNIYVYVFLFLLSAIFIYLYFSNINKYSDFKIISQEESIEILDTKGKKAILNSEFEFKSLKENIQEMDFIVNAAGSIKNSQVENGIIDQIIKEGSKTIFQIHTTKPIKKNDKYKIKFSCELLDTFLEKKEYWEINKFSTTSKLRLLISFPIERIPKEYKIYKIKGHKKHKAKKQPKLINKHKNPTLLVEIEKIGSLDKYRIEWTW